MPLTDGYREFQPAPNPIHRAYLGLMLWFVGRAIRAAAQTDRAVAGEFRNLPTPFAFRLGVMPKGPAMVVGKDSRGRVRFWGSRPPEGVAIDLDMKIKSMAGALRMFTFRESTVIATSRDRLIADGEVPWACAVVRILDAVEVYLLPKPIARLAVQRYPRWPRGRKFIGRGLIYLRAVTGV